MQVQAIERLTGYFHERLRYALGRRCLRLDDTLEVYLVDLLERYAATRPDRVLQPLVEHLSAALEASTPRLRLRRFREMGDAALCVCGLFDEHLAARGVSRRYVVHMGGHAYRSAGRLASVPGMGANQVADIYGELADRFDELAAVLDDVKEDSALRTPQDVVRMYERWRRSRSPVLAERLRKAGVYPLAGHGRALH